jgi:hypothetical protein
MIPIHSVALDHSPRSGIPRRAVIAGQRPARITLDIASKSRIGTGRLECIARRTPCSCSHSSRTRSRLSEHLRPDL